MSSRVLEISLSVLMTAALALKLIAAWLSETMSSGSCEPPAMFWAAVSSVFWAFFRPSIAVERGVGGADGTDVHRGLPWEGHALERIKPILRVDRLLMDIT